jgi:hypothetical protein
MKKVVTNSQVPHLWAHQTQSEARNSTGSLFFDGPTIYSYRTSFPIATHVTNERGEKAILFTTCDYSVTTSGHKSNVASSIPSGVHVFNVDLSNLDHWNGFRPAGCVAAYNEQIEEHERKAARARSTWSVDHELRRASETREEAIEFVAFYGLSETVRELSANLETVKAACKADAARKAQQIRLEKASREKEYADQIEAWLRGGSVNLPYGIDTMLRVKNGEVETSRGVSFPVDHARRGLVLVDAVKSSGEAWQRNGHTCHLGHYQIDRIEANGTVHAGCHVVTYKAIERVREQILQS